MSSLAAFVPLVFAAFGWPSIAPPADPPADAACKRDAVVLLLDRSGSMTGDPLAQAKNGAKRIVSKLGKEDCVEVVAFDSQPTRVTSLTPVVDRAAIERAIDGIAAGGGTEIFSSLDIARLDLLTAKSAKRKLVILLTDGQAPSNGIKDLAENMRVENMRVSTIGLGSSTDEKLLRMIADKTGGHTRIVKQPADLPKEMEEELQALRK